VAPRKGVRRGRKKRFGVLCEKEMDEPIRILGWVLDARERDSKRAASSMVMKGEGG